MTTPDYATLRKLAENANTDGKFYVMGEYGGPAPPGLRQYIEAARPKTILSLLDALEAKQNAEWNAACEACAQLADAHIAQPEAIRSLKRPVTQEGGS